jgi:hypothetical protein
MSVKSTVREHAVGLGLLPRAVFASLGQKGLDLVAKLRHHRSDRDVSPVERTKARAWYSLRHILSPLERDSLVFGAVQDGTDQTSSTWETNPGTKTRSNGPSPTTWYAMLTSPLRA